MENQKVTLSEKEFKERLLEMLLLTREQVEEIFLNVKSTMVESIISALLVRTQDEACIKRLGFICDRLYGSLQSSNPTSKDPLKAEPDITFLVAVNEGGRFVRQRPIQLQEQCEIIDL